MFPHQITVQWSPTYEEYVACVPALKAVARGRTPEEAVREVIEEANDIQTTISEDITSLNDRASRQWARRNPFLRIYVNVHFGRPA